MVRNIKQINFSNILGWVSLTLLTLVTFGTLAVVYVKSHNNFTLTPADFKIIKFTAYQALISATISSILGIFLARALTRQSFIGKSILIIILGAPFILPVVVAILGLISVFGRNGLFNNILEILGFENISIYGLHGIIIANIFFNLPLVSRLLLHGWNSIPTEQLRLAESLGFNKQDIFFLIELPMLRTRLPGIFAVVFLICVSSFSIALTLGGGPKSTTIELAIYQAFRYDFDLSKAANLAMIQFILCFMITVIVIWTQKTQSFQVSFDRVIVKWTRSNNNLIDWIIISLSSIFLIIPLLVILIEGIFSLHLIDASILVSLGRSILVAFGAVIICLFITFSLGSVIVTSNIRSKVRWLMESSAYFVIASSPLVIGTGFFIFLFPIINPIKIVFPMTALINAIMAVPFSLRIILPAMQKINQDYGKLSESIGLRGYEKFLNLTLPRMKREIGFSVGLISALSIGDLGVVTLFSSPQSGTLPLTIYRLMGSYQMDSAKAAAFLLLISCFIIFLLTDRLARANVKD